MDNYTSDSSDSDGVNKVIDFAYLLLEPEAVEQNLEAYIDENKRFFEIEKIILHHNQLSAIPENLIKFSNVKVLDISNNGLTTLPDILEYCPLTTLVAKNNLLNNASLPKCFSNCTILRELNLSGNQLRQFPEQVLNFLNLKYLYLGGNGMQQISKNIWKLKKILSFGGNELTEVPASLGLLQHLQALVLCDNQLESLPANIANLHKLKSLFLHKNKLRTLPPEIIALKNLTELSLRDNPLVVRFVSEMSYNPASLLELSARSIKLHDIQVGPGDIPYTLMNYLKSGHRCVNPHCKGVYFDNRVEHIKFVDFCGKYRIPLLQYLCSAKCATTRHEDFDRPARSYMMKKVLLG
ncbi:hypothetical protein NQ315_007830 [Exocentrus adspersus]|uniref:Leucine-rich repeat-containing protein 58 n=1 Tax=Exocentrus adspersus TaxID=1586481 RepID=A0AAV8W808_9CUCU|nr:hypothetical protein NQ315_007830 [Exocentrus adspersus]